MAIFTIEQLKSQLHIDHDEDDETILEKGNAAQNHLERLLGFKIEEEFEDDDIPPALLECVLQLAAYWYDTGAAVAVGESAQIMPIGIYDVVQEFRRWSWATA